MSKYDGNVKGVKKPQGMNLLWDLRTGGRIILKLISGKWCKPMAFCILSLFNGAFSTA